MISKLIILVIVIVCCLILSFIILHFIKKYKRRIAISEKKYKITNETIFYYDKTLRRIEALKDFADVKKGDKGGYIETEDNLSQEGNCWVYGNAKVLDLSRLYENAIIKGQATIYGSAEVGGNAVVTDNVKIYGRAKVYNHATIYDNAIIHGYSKIYDKAIVRYNANVKDNANVHDSVDVHDAVICGDADISSMEDYIVFKNWWSSGRNFTWTRSNNMWSVGCFYGTGEELITKAYKDSKLSGREYERVVKYVESILNDNKH